MTHRGDKLILAAMGVYLLLFWGCVYYAYRHTQVRAVGHFREWVDKGWSDFWTFRD